MSKKVIIEIMPECHIATHVAAQNWGTYPLNGAIRMVVTEEEAEELVASDEHHYTHIVSSPDADKVETS